MVENELRPDEVEILAETCRMLDLLDALRLSVTDIVVAGKIAPALVELRQVRQELRRALAQLCLQDAREEDEELPLDVVTMRSARARKAARVRWSHDGA
jgi:hypothetical protein